MAQTAAAADEQTAAIDTNRQPTAADANDPTTQVIAPVQPVRAAPPPPLPKAKAPPADGAATPANNEPSADYSAAYSGEYGDAAAYSGDAAAYSGDAAAYSGDAAAYSGDAAAYSGDAAAYSGYGDQSQYYQGYGDGKRGGRGEIELQPTTLRVVRRCRLQFERRRIWRLHVDASDLRLFSSLQRRQRGLRQISAADLRHERLQSILCGQSGARRSLLERFGSSLLLQGYDYNSSGYDPNAYAGDAAADYNYEAAAYSATQPYDYASGDNSLGYDASAYHVGYDQHEGQTGVVGADDVAGSTDVSAVVTPRPPAEASAGGEAESVDQEASASADRVDSSSDARFSAFVAPTAELTVQISAPGEASGGYAADEYAAYGTAVDYSQYNAAAATYDDYSTAAYGAPSVDTLADGLTRPFPVSPLPRQAPRSPDPFSWETQETNAADAGVSAPMPMPPPRPPPARHTPEPPSPATGGDDEGETATSQRSGLQLDIVNVATARCLQLRLLALLRRPQPNSRRDRRRRPSLRARRRPRLTLQRSRRRHRRKTKKTRGRASSR